MTALGNVMALVQELQEEEVSAKGETPGRSGFTFSAACSCVCASSLGDVLGCIRELRGESLREFIATLPPVQAPRNAVPA